ncbi:senecionine N-oxygenase-like isoform X2 [Schistocerca americana]|uniref:senecionine N-oxygenase-like isoform X2 n=1 Tax=Schistocerca americana TaxID=7009 RepID=UPI001F4FD120|nr:senecionine N-oxygenase-like isoform X2 [Schistocerca americana]
MKMQVAVIGAGASGLAAARHLLESPRDHSVTVFERGDQLGGTWVFTEKTGLDVDGRPVHSSMYLSLETNLPKEVMAFPDYPFPEGEKSYLPAGDVLKYLNSYAEHFGLRRCIKFRQHVERVQPRGSVWEVSATNMDTAEVTTYQFDSVMVCSGHYWKEKRPQLKGSREFRGRQSHAHNYRRPDAYRGRRVLLIGSGPSGMDLALEVASVAQQVILSHHLDKSIGHLFPSNVIEKPDVTSITETGANFRDGTFCEVDDICYCTVTVLRCGAGRSLQPSRHRRFTTRRRGGEASPPRAGHTSALPGARAGALPQPAGRPGWGAALAAGGFQALRDRRLSAVRGPG